MNEWTVLLAASLVACVPWLLLEVFDGTRQQELRVLTGEHVPQVRQRTTLRWATAGACAVVGLTAAGDASGYVPVRSEAVLFPVAFLTLVMTTPLAWTGMRAASRDLYGHVSATLEHEPRIRVASLTRRTVSDGVSRPAQLVPFLASFSGMAIVALGAMQGWSGFARPALPVAFTAVGLTLVLLYRAWMGAEANAPELPEHLLPTHNGPTRRARIRAVFLVQVWLAVGYAIIGSALAATNWVDPVGKLCGELLLLAGGGVGIWASARALASEHGIPTVAGVVRERAGNHP